DLLGPVTGPHRGAVTQLCHWQTSRTPALPFLDTGFPGRRREGSPVLSQAENELLCRVEGDAPMGRLMRRYWQPMLLAEELETRSELRQKIVDRDLVATRDAHGAFVVRDAERIYPLRV